MPPDRTTPIAETLEQVRRRRITLDVVEALAIATTTTSVVAWLAAGLIGARAAWTAASLVGALCGAAVFWRRRAQHTAAAAARAIERTRPQARNVVVTAEELERYPERASPWMTERVRRDAARALTGLTVGEVAHWRRTAIVASAAVVVLALGILLPTVREAASATASVTRRVIDAAQGREAQHITVSVRPPAYSGLEPRTLVDPERIEVLEGTHLELTSATRSPMLLRFGSKPLGTLGGTVTIPFVARDSGYFAVELPGEAAKLMALSVVRDRSPSVRIEKPARDLLLPNAARDVPVHVSASDDLGLTSLELRYTKVSGAGEQFEFQEGSLPLRVARGSGRNWQADAQLSLAALKLSPGDSLVYRAVARDARPGEAGLGASDTFYVEIAGPGQVPLEGIEMPPEEERYALSQQMIVLKIERLKAREASMTRDALTEESALIAAEQRSVRANFIFLLGGHVEDEEVEAEQSSEITEGRLENTARRDITRAIGHMTRAEQGLVAINTTVALPPARAAVEALQRAFGRSRYLLRSLASRTPLDPSRRLTGNTSTADVWRRAIIDADPREGAALRSLLDRLIAAYDTLDNPGAPPNLAALAEAALAIDPGAAEWQQTARTLQAAHEQRGRPAEARKLLDAVIGELAGKTAAGLIPASGAASQSSPLERAWRGGGQK